MGLTRVDGPRRSRVPQLAVLDMAGTTVDVAGLREDSLSRVLASHGTDPESAEGLSLRAAWNRTGGASTFSVFRELFDDDLEAAHRANRMFEATFDALVRERGVCPMPGASEAIGMLREQGVLVCLVTGFGRHTQNTILESLGWMGLADLSLCPSDAGRGRPFPDLVLTAVLALDVDDVRDVLVVGDSVNDMLTGVRAGARDVVGVTTGAHTAAELIAAGATDVVDSVGALPVLERARGVRA
ncbi:HAD family hydrolase [Falsarthrobacter nasiphocae]|uniref:Phosphonatase-like hydrolase n=1 Tax=Falsarthrobacter nasiphocae TaxID=189863 RepID=A0AAE3YGX1_9MICC|nr:HAD family hydrolase [Falsarthrobacter nasiphocae]MDR6891776.1 phosphonatase-like hydrolase [Falsarthrobacter nasiphocae]